MLGSCLHSLPAKSHPRQSLLPEPRVAALLPASQHFSVRRGTAVWSSCLFNGRETERLLQLLGAGCLPGQKAAAPDLNTLPPLWVQVAAPLQQRGGVFALRITHCSARNRDLSLYFKQLQAIQARSWHGTWAMRAGELGAWLEHPAWCVLRDDVTRWKSSLSAVLEENYEQPSLWWCGYTISQGAQQILARREFSLRSACPYGTRVSPGVLSLAVLQEAPSCGHRSMGFVPAPKLGIPH